MEDCYGCLLFPQSPERNVRNTIKILATLIKYESVKYDKTKFL